MTIPQLAYLSHRTTFTVSATASAWLLTMACVAHALAGETATPKPHSLIHRPDAPALPTVPQPESAVILSRPAATTAPAVTPPSSQTLHHKLTKKPASAVVNAPLTSEPSPSSRTSSRLSSAGIIPATVPQTGSEGPSKSAPAPAGDRTIVPIVPIAPVATRPLSMSSLSNLAAPTASRNAAAAAPLTAAAQSNRPIASLAPSMSRLVQMSPGLAGLLQPSAPVVAPSSTTPPPATPPATPPPVSNTGSVTLSWSANGENDLAGYKIYFGTSSGNYTASGSPTVIGKATSYTVTGLQRNTTYFFALSAYDSAGNESALSGEASKSIL